MCFVLGTIVLVWSISNRSHGIYIKIYFNGRKKHFFQRINQWMEIKGIFSRLNEWDWCFSESKKKSKDFSSVARCNLTRLMSFLSVECECYHDTSSLESSFSQWWLTRATGHNYVTKSDKFGWIEECKQVKGKIFKSKETEMK